MNRRWLIILVVLFLSLPVQAGQPQASDPNLRTLLKQAIAKHDSFKDRFDAEVWLVDMSRRLAPLVPDPEKRLKLRAPDCDRSWYWP